MTDSTQPSRAVAESRLLRLTALLLARREPATFEEIRAQLPDEYAGRPEAAEKKWTRDKKALLEAGIPIQFVEPDEEAEGGYLIDPRAYYLPEIKLSPAELAVLWAAGHALVATGSHPWHQDLASALRKLCCLEVQPGTPPRLPAIYFGDATGEPARRHLEALGRAVRTRKRIRITYFTAGRATHSERDVDVYGFAWRRGIWLFAGHCHLRGSRRVFYLSRVRELRVNDREPARPDYAIPEDFDIRAFSAQQPWQYFSHEPVEARVRFTGALAPLAGQLLPGAQLLDEDGAAMATLQVTHLGALVRQVLGWGPEAMILAPEQARTQAREILSRIVGASEAA